MKKKFLLFYLQCTVNVATKDVPLSTSLLATHLYSPLSILFTFVTVSCLLSGDKLILGLAVTFFAIHLWSMRDWAQEHPLQHKKRSH